MQILLEMSVFLLKNIRQQSSFQSLLEEEKKKNLNPYSNPDYTKADRILSVKSDT